ncbi:MAG: hypothetical protein AB7F78_23715, partial [Hyphomicrobiaceae bacterium]
QGFLCLSSRCNDQGHRRGTGGSREELESHCLLLMNLGGCSYFACSSASGSLEDAPDDKATGQYCDARKQRCLAYILIILEFAMHGSVQPEVRVLARALDLTPHV